MGIMSRNTGNSAGAGCTQRKTGGAGHFNGMWWTGVCRHSQLCASTDVSVTVKPTSSGSNDLETCTSSKIAHLRRISNSCNNLLTSKSQLSVLGLSVATDRVLVVCPRPRGYNIDDRGSRSRDTVHKARSERCIHAITEINCLANHAHSPCEL